MKKYQQVVELFLKQTPEYTKSLTSKLCEQT